MGKRDISGLTEAQSTLLMPLWARAIESRRADPLLRDHRAAEIVESLDFDFDRFRRMRVPQADYCVRAVVLDQLVQEFLRDTPDGTVVEFGVGLDTRFDRLDNGRVNWIELDLPHVIDVREQFFESTDRRHMIRGSLNAVDWIPEVKALGNGPWLFIAEGVLYFLTGSEVLVLLDRMVNGFAAGSFLFDTQSPWYLWFSNLRQPMSDATMKFSLGNVAELSRANAKLSVRRWIGFGDSPHYDRSLPRVSRTKRWARQVCPWIRGMFKIVQVDW